MSTEEVPVDTPSRAVLWLEIDLDATPIRGTLHTCGGDATPFVGWLGLTAGLEELRTEKADDHKEDS